MPPSPPAEMDPPPTSPNRLNKSLVKLLGCNSIETQEMPTSRLNPANLSFARIQSLLSVSPQHGPSGHSCGQRSWLTVFLLFGLVLGVCRAQQVQGEQGMRRTVGKSWNTSSGLASNEVTSITQTEDGYLWIGTSCGASRFDGVRFTPVSLDGARLTARVRKLVARGKEVWISLADSKQNLLILESGNTDARSFPHPKDAPLLDLIQMNNGGVYGLAPEGIERLDVTGEKHIPYPAEIKPHFNELVASFGRTQPANLLQIGDGALLLVMLNKVWRWNGDTWKEWDQKPKDDALSPPAILDPQGRIWISSGNGGIWRQTAKGWEKVNFAPGEIRQINTIAFDESGKPILAPKDGGLGEVRKDNEAPGGKSQIQLENFPEIMPETEVNVIFSDAEGNLWFGLQDQGITRIGPSSPSIKAMAVTKNQAIWLAPGSGGLRRFADGVITSFNETSGLRSTNIETVCMDHQGDVWVGTLDAGLAKWNGEKFLAVGIREGLLEECVTQILDDGKGTLWVAGNHGIYGLRLEDIESLFSGEKQQITPHKLDASDIFSLEKGETIDYRGKIRFRTGSGELQFDGQPADQKAYTPVAIVESAEVNGLKADFSEKTGGVTVDPNPSSVEFTFTALKTPRNEDVEFQYRLTGLQSSWTYAGGERTAQFKSLSPGDYLFEVQARSAFGDWNQASGTLKLKVQAALWQRTWFQWVASILTLTIIYLEVANIRSRRRHAKQEEHRRVTEAERTRISKDLHDSLGSTLTQVAMLSEAAEGSVADREKLITNLRKISHSAAQGVKSLDEMIWETDPNQDTVDSTLEYICLSIESMTTTCGINFQTNYTEPAATYPLSITKRHNLYLAIKEATNNAIKYSKAKTLSLWVNINQKLLKIEIEDDGIGFNPDLPTSSGSHGLVNMSSRMNSIGGTVTIKSLIGKGTKISFETQLD